MAKLRQPYEQARMVPWLGDRIVQPGEVVTVADVGLESWLAAGWVPADGPTIAKAKAILGDEYEAKFGSANAAMVSKEDKAAAKSGK